MTFSKRLGSLAVTKKTENTISQVMKIDRILCKFFFFFFFAEGAWVTLSICGLWAL